MPTLSIDYGFDIHSIEIASDELDLIEAGQKVELEGQGFLHEFDGFLRDHWIFNSTPGEVMFWLDNGATFHGTILRQ